MYIGEQLINPTDDRLRLSAQLGAEGIVDDARPNHAVLGDNGSWDNRRLAQRRRYVEGFGMKYEGLALDVGSVLLDSLHNPEKAAATMDRLRRDILAAGDAGIPMVKYMVGMVGITRTAPVIGRGGVKCSSFKAASYSQQDDVLYSYRGTLIPEEGDGALLDEAEAGGQVLATQIDGVSRAQGWQAIEYLVHGLLPAAEKAGVRLACHPHDPAYPPEGLNGVHHVLGSLEGMRQFIVLAPESPWHGFNFCQGTIAEMATDPNATVLEAIREFGPQKRIFMVHFRNIVGGYLDFHEVMPDEGVVDMAASIRAYREVGYEGVLCPDHVPQSDLDPDRERFFAFCLGYTKALIQTQ
ncbi:mannonate dehydratase [Pelagibacterium limicola]|uniref:mannonate dehydratase n=1 Tax=Pelagibacterium limicola TaxID=2791022 RepID=UPI0018B004C8|nr:mannonate dehydratase [Pelagibacterium limicola]